MSLRVRTHPRGHISSCNGNLHQLETKVVHYLDDPSLNAVERAALVQEWTKKEGERKAQRLAKFQKEVKVRVSARGKLMQQEMAATSTKAMQSEQDAAERALKLDDNKVRPCIAMGHDVEDVKVIASGKDSHFSQHQSTRGSSALALQTARNTLLSQSCIHPDISNQQQAESLTSPSQKSHNKSYQAVEQLSSEACTSRLSIGPLDKSHGGSRHSKSPKGTIRKFTAPGQLKHMEQIQAGKQYQVFRKLYSDLEREQVRKKKLQSSHSHQVEAIKRKKEEERRRIEEEVNSVHSSSFISTSTSEDKQMAAEWAELMLLEERKHQLQRAKEMERYMAALKVRLKEQMEMKKIDIPPLCLCGKTLWDTNPKTCANNCVFYRNTKAYVKALSNLLQSLDA